MTTTATHAETPSLRIRDAARLGPGEDDHTIAVNDGPAAGRTVPHLHVHVIPVSVDKPLPRGGVRGLFVPAGEDPWIAGRGSDGDGPQTVPASTESAQHPSAGGTGGAEAAETISAGSCTCRVPASRCDGHCSGNWVDPDCSWHGTRVRADPDCVVHRGRRARGPKPPPVGPGCICDGSGRTCPRHGAVI